MRSKNLTGHLNLGCSVFIFQVDGLVVDTLKREMDFIGTPGEVYYFRAQATDKVNNVGSWVEVGPVEVIYREQRRGQLWLSG